MTPTHWELAAFTILIAVVGMPHGGLDHMYGRAWLRPLYGRMWPIYFGLSYLGLAGVVILGWFLAPGLTVVLFFLISAVHFGEASRWGLPLSMIEGGMVIWIPLLVRPTETAEILAWVVPGGNAGVIGEAIRWSQPVLWAIAMGLIGSTLVDDIEVVIHRLVLAALLALTPTLIGFVVYFCGVHSLRELAILSRKADAVSPWRGFAKVMLWASPAAGAAVLGIAAIAIFFGLEKAPEPAVVQAVFIGLSAVAVPHILLHAVTRWRGVDPWKMPAVML